MIIITGAAGFIGSAIVWQLNQEGINDILLVDSLGSDEKWKNLVNLKYIDFLDKKEFLTLIEQGTNFGDVQFIIHMGANS